VLTIETVGARVRTGTEHARGKPGRPRDPGRDEAIVDAVVMLLREPGTGKIGMREVAARSGTSLAAIYRRWPSREDLLLDAIQHFVEEDAPVPDAGDLRADLLAVLETMIRRREAFIESLPRLIAEAASSPQIIDAVRRRLLGLAGRSLTTVLRRARSETQIPAGADLDLAADTAVALFTHQAITCGRPPTRAYVARIVDHALLPMLGLGIPGPPPSDVARAKPRRIAPEGEKPSR
jgi:AcrR family transcriptional regulator